MSQQNPQIIRDLYAAFARGDGPAVLATFDPEIVWNEAENIAYADRNPYHGPQQIAEGVFGRVLSDFEGFTATPEQIIHDGDTVVALGRYRGVNHATGVPLNAQFAHVWTFRNGKIARFQQYTDTAQFQRVSSVAPLNA